MNTIDVMKQALSAIRYCQEYKMGLPSFVEAANDLEEAIKQEEQAEPVAWMQDSIELYVQDRPSAAYPIPLYARPKGKE